ncbi:MAG: DUF4214 domain-containing protein [Acidobacteria bacterium]|nr:DUF4214 domain-containing protein [Acidobacteriota bacterium]
MSNKLKFFVTAFTLAAALGWLMFRAYPTTATQINASLSAPFQRKVLETPPEAPFELRFFETAVKTDSQGKIITGPTSDPVKNIMGAESAGVRAGLERFTKIMFGASYIDGRPDPGTRIDPNNPQVKSGNQFWPNRKQPFRSEPRSLALSQDGRKLYVALPGREGYPDWRVAVMDTGSRQVVKWIDLRPQGTTRGLRPISVKAAPINTAISANPYVVVLNMLGNFASVIDVNTDTVTGEFETGFYGEKSIFNKTGTRLYITDRYKDEVRAFRVDAGPKFTQIAEIPTGNTALERANPRDLDLSEDGKTLYVANTMGHTLAAINVDGDANTLVKVLPVGGLSTDVKIAGRWGIVSGQETNTKLNGKESGHGLPTKDANGVVIKNNGQPLGYTPVMSDATKATTFDDIGSELNIFDTTTNQFVFRYVDEGRDISQLVTPGQYVDLHDHTDAQKKLKGSGPEQLFVRGDMLFVTYAHSEQVQAFRINRNASDPSQILTPAGFEFTGGITPQGVEASPDGKTIYVANFQTEDVSFLGVDASGNLSRQGYVPVGVTPTTPDPTTGGHGAQLFATDEEVGLRWFFSSAYSDDGQKSCGFCHWDGRQDGCQWNVAANAVGGTKVCPQNKDISDNWPEWYEGLNNDFMAYASACNGEVLLGERTPTPLFPQADPIDRFHAREDYVLQKTEADSRAIGRPELSGKAMKVGYYDMAYLQILWSQNEVRRLPSPLGQFPETDAQAAKVARGKDIFTKGVNEGGSGCAECHHNGNRFTNGALDDTFQDYNIHEPGVISESTVDGNGPFFRPTNDYFFTRFAPPQDVGTPQNFSSRNTKHLRALWDAVPRYLHYGFAHSLREMINPALAANNIRVIKETHGKTSQLSADDLDALEAYLNSLSMSGKSSSSGTGPGPSPTPTPATTPTPNASPSPTPSPGASPSPTPSPGATPTPTPGSGGGGSGSNSPTVQLSATSFAVAEQAGNAQITVTRSGDLSQEAKVDYTTADFSASDRSDYTMARGTLRFAPGEATKTITVLLTDDSFVEPDEQVNVSLSNGGGCSLGEQGSAMLTIVDNDTSLSGTNPSDDAQFFTREHYHDFLNREPDESGLAFWADQLNACGTDVRCIEEKRVNVSAAFFLSIEFQQTGYFVDRLFKASFANRPSMAEFLPDTQEAGRGVVVGAPGWEQQLETNKRSFVEQWVTRADFRNTFDALSNDQFVDRLFANAGVTPDATERSALVGGLNAGTQTRASVLRRVSENAEFTKKEFNPAFVLMQYLGYLRRDPDEPGFNFWLNKLNSFNGNFVNAEMVKAFIVSDEYKKRFGSN